MKPPPCRSTHLLTPPAPPHPRPHPPTPNPRAGEPYVNFSVADYSDEGEELLNGTLVERWVREEPRDPYFPPVLFELMFVDQRNAQSARPVLAQTILQPYGVVRGVACNCCCCPLSLLSARPAHPPR